ncbi:RNA polymerase sigma factor [Pseudacidovorax intermedius]|uniref:RNA polymerase sigma-70 factor (ECF subfamily) n=1 Tax=Pseudacidovorax intermedius TaxID=433924 RepID=A0A370F8U1_9BURK|nr:sigma-70 family RNA polymerase sigma factor [Pseudacidovorax intermedius]RDI18619.1 RNA polymerase sigma-70 factor (ECF subfamily) [Pseudacidovorax intermedius]
MPSATTPDDELLGLLDRVARRDASALQALYERTSSRLFGLAMRVVRQHEWAEDVLQEAFLTIWRSAPDYRATLSPPMAWMSLIVRSRALDLLRRQTSQGGDVTQEFSETLADTLPASEPGPQELADASEQAWLLHQCLQQLPNAQREALSLAYLRDLSHSELATRLAQPLGTIKTWIRRGLDKLRVCMEQAA